MLPPSSSRCRSRSCCSSGRRLGPRHQVAGGELPLTPATGPAAMNQDTVVNLATQAMGLALKVAGPMLLAGSWSACSSPSFRPSRRSRSSPHLVPKIVAFAVVSWSLGPWMLGQLISYTADLYTSIPTMVGRVTHAAQPARGQPARRLHPRAGARDPLFLLAPLFSSTVIPHVVKGMIAVGISIGLDADRDARPAHTERRRCRSRGWFSRGSWSGSRFAFALAALMAAVESPARSWTWWPASPTGAHQPDDRQPVRRDVPLLLPVRGR